MSSLSRGIYKPSDFTEMEINMLSAMQWRVNPPTSVSFVAHFISILPSGAVNRYTQLDLFECARFQTELAVNEPNYSGTKASTIAFAAIWNALDIVASCELTEAVQSSFQCILEKITSIRCHSSDFMDVMEGLLKASTQNKPGVEISVAQHNFPCETTAMKISQICQKNSPRCVSTASFEVS